LVGWLVGCWLLDVGCVWEEVDSFSQVSSSRIRFSFQNKTKALRRAQVTVANL